MERIKVAVSPFYRGEGWVDEKTLITFEPNEHALNVYSIPADLDLSGIKKAIQLNTLILVEGNVGDFNKIEEIVVESPKVEEPVKEEEPVVEEPKEEESLLDVDLDVKIQEAPKKKAAKKKATK